MNENLKYGLFFLGGLTLGVIGTVAISKGKLDLKTPVTELISRGLDARDAVMAKVDSVKEHMEDMMAEAEHRSAQRRASAENV